MYPEYIFLGVGVIAILFAFVLALSVKKKSKGTKRMSEISDIIKSGAGTYLKKQYKIISVVAFIVSIFLAVFLNIQTAIAFLFGSFLSGLSGVIGMSVATSSNVRTTEGCRKSLKDGLKIAFSSGVVIGMTVVGLGLIGVVISYLIFKDLEILLGFGLGASLIAFFARIGGGIFTKAADVGADLVGKVEKGIPEDDARNPAAIADNVGDNVGDVAGMGADLFESYVQSIIAAMSLGLVFFNSSSLKGALFPLLIACIGILGSIIGTFFVKLKSKNPYKTFHNCIFISTLVVAVLSFFAVKIVLGKENINVFFSILTGLLVGIVIGLSIEYYTSFRKKPVKQIAKASETGAATNIIAGFSNGMISTIIPVLVIVIAIILSFKLSGLFGIAIAAVGMLSTLGITLATNAYGPISDNAAGIAEMSKLDGEVRNRAETLDAVGNTTSAIGRGFDMSSAALTSLAILSVFGEKANLNYINILTPDVLGGLFIGALLPFVISAITIKSVGKTAFSMVKEIRKQFKENKNILKGKDKPDYTKPIDISTEAALKEMIFPGALTILAPIIVGLSLGVAALGGLLVSTIVSSFILALTLSNSGSSWDNAKKYIEQGNLGGKNSEAHKSAVIGDTIGDPFKDTAGPSLNILIKIVSVVALLYLIIIG